MLLAILYQNSNGMMLFGKIDETFAILIVAIGLIGITIGIRWALSKYDTKTNSKSEENEALH